MKTKTICKVTFIAVCICLIIAGITGMLRANVKDETIEETRVISVPATTEPTTTIIEVSETKTDVIVTKEDKPAEETTTTKKVSFVEDTTFVETTANKSLGLSLKTIKVSDAVYYNVPISNADQDFIREVCKYYNFDNKLVYQIMKVESDFNPNCVSETDDHGIMQLNARWYKEYLNYNDDYDKYLTNFNIYDIRQNVIVAIRELCSWRTVCEKRGYYEVADMLEAYNRGYGYFNNPSKKIYSTKVLSVVIEVK